MNHDPGNPLMSLGSALLAAGAAVRFGGRFPPFGRLTGDFAWRGQGRSVHFPLASSIVLANVFFRRRDIGRLFAAAAV